MKRVEHQFSLFPFQPPSKRLNQAGVKEVKEAKEAYNKGDFKVSAKKLEEAREALERKFGI